MDNIEFRRRLRAPIEAHDEVFRALREANQSMGRTNHSMGAAIQAHDDAIQGALAANRAALDLLNWMEDGGNVR